MHPDKPRTHQMKFLNFSFFAGGDNLVSLDPDLLTHLNPDQFESGPEIVLMIRIRIRIHMTEAWILGSGSTPKCHRSATLYETLNRNVGPTLRHTPQENMKILRKQQANPANSMLYVLPCLSWHKTGNDTEALSWSTDRRVDWTSCQRIPNLQFSNHQKSISRTIINFFLLDLITSFQLRNVN